MRGLGGQPLFVEFQGINDKLFLSLPLGRVGGPCLWQFSVGLHVQTRLGAGLRRVSTSSRLRCLSVSKIWSRSLEMDIIAITGSFYCWLANKSRLLVRQNYGWGRKFDGERYGVLTALGSFRSIFRQSRTFFRRRAYLDGATQFSQDCAALQDGV